MKVNRGRYRRHLLTKVTTGICWVQLVYMIWGIMAFLKKVVIVILQDCTN